MKRILLILAFLSPLTAALAQVLTLDSCLALARRNNVEIRTSQMEVESAIEVKRQVFTKYFQQVNLAGIGYHSVKPLIHFSIEDIQSSDMRSLLQDIYDLVAETGSDVKKEVSLMRQGASGSVIVGQPIYAGGRIATGNKLAQLGVEAAELQNDMKVRDVLENIESTYYLVVGLQQKVATVSAALALIDSLDRTVQVALDNGLVTRADALQLQLKRNEMLANQQQLLSGIKLSRRLLCCQIGIEHHDDIVFGEQGLSSDESAIPLEKISSGAGSRPETRLLELSVDAEKLSKRLTLGESLPQLTFIGSVYYGNMIKNDATANAVALLSLSVPLTGWFETSHKLNQHNIRIAEASMKQEHLNRMMALEEEKSYSDMVDAWMLLKSDSAALDVARENYRLATLNYSAGVNTLSEVLQAHALMLQAENAITDRRTTYVMARRRLLDLRQGRTGAGK
jgi:outer membrane protein TolC